MAAKLVTVGDSLTQGFQSGSISKTHLSWPAMVAGCLGSWPGWPESAAPPAARSFRVPDFSGAGGLPLNLEGLLRLLQGRYGSRINWLELVPAFLSVMSFMDRVEDYWERDVGAGPSDTGPLHHNLAVWGFELGDCDTLTEAACRRAIPRPKDDPLYRSQIPEMPMYRTARRTLNPSFDKMLENLTQLDAAARIARDEGIENLFVFLGANNCLATVTSLKIAWSQSADLYKLSHDRECNLWAPEHFQKLLDKVVPKIQAITAQHTFIGTVPHVTIAPVSRGVSLDTTVNNGRDADGYYEFYTHFWIWDEDFRNDPDAYPKLTREDARTIDGVIDAYNGMLKAAAAKNGWHVVDLCALLDGLAFRRSGGRPSYAFPPELVDALQANEGTRHRVTPDGVLLDSRYLSIFPAQTVPWKKYRGGLFSLDGIHPTTIGYGLVAHKVLQSMVGVSLPAMPLMPWPEIVKTDSLVLDLPPILENLKEILAFLSRKGPLQKLTKALGTGFMD